MMRTKIKKGLHNEVLFLYLSVSKITSYDYRNGS
jgi:hypothetical protein